ncbi:MAG: hypothetical protein ACRDJ5_06700 [Actinomycetota bacterium]
MPNETAAFALGGAAQGAPFERRSGPLPPGTYTIKGRLKPKDGGMPAEAEKTFEIVAA